MAVIPYLSQGIGVPIDPLTGMPRKKKTTTAQPSFVNPWSTAQNPSGYANPAFMPVGARTPMSLPVSPSQPYTVPGFTPDYKALIEAALGPLSAQLGAEGVQDMTARNSQLVRALGQFGQEFDPAAAQQAFGNDFFQQSGLGELLPQANQLARQTTESGMSFVARAKQAQEKAVQQIQDALAGRGLLRSGATGVALQQQQQEFDTAQYDARLQLQDFLSAVHQGYTQAQRARQMQLEAATREEAARQAQLNPATGSRTVYPGDDGYPATPPPPSLTPQGRDRNPLPPGWIGNPDPIDINKILGETVKPPKKLPTLPGGGGTINRWV